MEKFNIYGQVIDTPEASAKAIVSVTLSDTADLPGGICRGLLVGTAGTANLVDASDNEVSSLPLQVGYNPIQVKRIKTGGTAANIWALY
ncbi:MAG: hypothetical protein WCD42_14390 [Rhizomicrobium sp.]